LFYFVFEGNFPSTSPWGAFIWRGDLTEGFLHYRIGELIFGGAYTWRSLFLEFYCIPPYFNLCNPGGMSRGETREAWAATLFLGQTEAWSVVIGLPVACPVIKWKKIGRLRMKTTILLAVFYQKTTGARFLDSVPCNASQKNWFLEFSLLFLFLNTVKWTCPISITISLFLRMGVAKTIVAIHPV